MNSTVAHQSTSIPAQRVAHFDAARAGLAAALATRLLERAQESARQIDSGIMCNQCRGSGGWGCGEDAQRCEPCEGTGRVEVPVLPREGEA